MKDKVSHLIENDVSRKSYKYNEKKKDNKNYVQRERVRKKKRKKNLNNMLKWRKLR